MNESRDVSLHRQRLRELCAATGRALANNGDLHFRGKNLYRGKHLVPIRAPHLRQIAAVLDAGGLGNGAENGRSEMLSALRAMMDGVALRLRCSDAEQHRQMCPARPIAYFVFELLEQLRVESMVATHMPGQRQNLHRRFAQWSTAFHRAGHTESAVGLLLFSISQIGWARLSSQPIPDELDGLIESTRANLAPMIGAHLAGMKRHRFSQRAFAEHALAIALKVDELIQHERAERGDDEGDDEQINARNDTRTMAALALTLNVEAENDEDGFTGGSATRHRMPPISSDVYRVFTTRYDVEVRASTLVRQPQLKVYRGQLDAMVSESGINVARFARQLMPILAAPVPDGWNAGEDEGVLDGARLEQCIVTPGARGIFKQSRKVNEAAGSVSILIDCSGSMKAHIEMVAVLVDILTRAVDMIGAESEVLGFTTAAWNGGRAKREWLAGGRAEDPGRMNERCHLIFKSADQRWRQSRPSIGALLKADIFREGIDGEAVEWAAARMQARESGRRILIVVSDGCPMDSATQRANDEAYLDNHLKQVVAKLVRAGNVEIMGLGVGLDLSPYYPRSMGFNAGRKVDSGLLRELIQLMAGGKRY